MLATGCVQQITEVVEVTASSGDGGGGGDASYLVPDPNDDCEVACDKLIGCANLPHCAARCKAVDRSECDFERMTLEICIAREFLPGLCVSNLGCGDATNLWLQCMNVGFEGQCAVDEPGGCECSMSDAAGHSYSMQCSDPTPEGAATCQCIRDGVAVGMCLDNNPCDATRGCCAPLFFIEGVAP